MALYVLFFEGIRIRLELVQLHWSQCGSNGFEAKSRIACAKAHAHEGSSWVRWVVYLVAGMVWVGGVGEWAGGWVGWRAGGRVGGQMKELVFKKEQAYIHTYICTFIHIRMLTYIHAYILTFLLHTFCLA